MGLVLFLAFPPCGWNQEIPKADPPLEAVSGLNLWARPGLFVEDVAQAYASPSVLGIGSFIYETYHDRSVLLVPAGASLSLWDRFNLYANGNFQSTSLNANPSGDLTGLNRITFGGQFLVPLSEGFNWGTALDLSLGSFYNDKLTYTTDFNPKVTLTYTHFKDWLFTVEFGVYMPDHYFPVYLQNSWGLSYAFTPSFAGIAEFIHHQMGGPAVPGTIGVVGFRLGEKFQLQGFVGTQIDSAEAPTLITGFGLMASSL